MRIDCEQCGAVFSIDDKMITPRGVRAQCPRCSAQRVVKPAAADATVKAPNPFAPAPSAATTAASGPAGQNPFAPPTQPAAQNPFAAPGTPAASGAPQAGANPFAPAPPSGQNPFAPAAGGSTASMSDPFGGGVSTGPAADPFGAPAAKNPFSPAGNAPPTGANPFAPVGKPPAGSDPFGAPPSGPLAAASTPPSAAPPAANPFSAAPPSDPFAATAPPPPAAAPPANNASASDLFGQPPATGMVLSEPTDASISLELDSGSGNHFHEDPDESAFAPPASSDPFEELGIDEGPPPDSAAAQRWRVEATGGSSQDLSLDELRNMIRKGSLGPDDLAGPMGGNLRPIGDDPTLSISLPKPRGGSGAISKPKGARALSTGFNARPLILAAVAIAVIVGAIAVYGQRARIFGSSVDSSDNPFRRALSQWTLQFPDVDGTSQEQVVEGRRYMRADTAVGYRRADEHFRKALILDPGNVDAIVGFVENYANMPGVGAGADPQGIDLALSGIDYTLAKQQSHAGLRRAKGALLLALGRVDDAQRELVQAKRLDVGDVSTKLLLAKTHLDRDAAEARRLIEEVQREAPELKSALPVAGGAHRRLGNYQKARDFLTSRLEADPGNVPALFELARLELDLDRPQRAVNALRDLTRADEQDVQARLMMAKVLYQLMGKRREAKTELSFIVDNLESVAGRLLLDTLVHQAYLTVVMGDPTSGAKIAERALSLDKASAPALFVLGRAYAAGGELPKAKEALERAVRVLPETPQAYFMPVVRTQLADVQWQLGDEVNAKRNYDRAVVDDPAFFPGYLGLAASHMRQQQTPQAATVIRRVLDIDPRHVKDNDTLTDFPTPAADLLNYANEYKKARVSRNERALKLVGEGIILYHADKRSRAAQQLKAALKSDPNAHGALLYLGVMALEDGNAREAFRRLSRAVRTTAKTHALTHIYLARAEIGLGKLVEAEHRLTEQLDADPTSVLGRYALSELKLKRNNASEAQTILRQLLNDAGDYRPIKHRLGQLAPN